MKSPPRALRGQRIFTTEGFQARDVIIRDGAIETLLPIGTLPDSQVQDVEDLLVIPGLVDTHVHINEPGRTEWEGFTTATQAAAAGGITTLVDMPLNSIPVTTTVEALNQKRQAAENQLWVDCGFYGGVVPGNLDQLEPLIHAGVMGFKAFLIHSGIDDFPAVTEADLQAAMPILAKHNIPLLVHAELDCISHNHTWSDLRYYQDYLASRPRQWELDAISLMIRLCRETRCPVHIVHLSCADALPMILDAKAEGLPLTVETCPHYLTLFAETVLNGDTRFKCAPPIREQENNNRLWQGLEEGIIDFIVSDHSPCTPELKLLELGDFQGAWGGISSLQFGLSLVWTEAQRRGYSIRQLVQWMCESPARFVRLNRKKGAIAPGYDADLVVWDPEASFVIRPEMVLHRNKVTPYEGKTLFGLIHKTYVRGQLVYDQGHLSSNPMGQALHVSLTSTEGVTV